MTQPRAPRVALRIHCCRCGLVRRFTTAGRAAFLLADELLARPCDGALASGDACASRDRRLELRPLGG